MHIADFSVGMLGANGVVGGGFGIATGRGARAAAAGLGRGRRLLLRRQRGQPGRLPRERELRRGPPPAGRLRVRGQRLRDVDALGALDRAGADLRPGAGVRLPGRGRGRHGRGRHAVGRGAPPWSGRAPATGRRSSWPPATGSAATTSGTRRTTAARTRQRDVAGPRPGGDVPGPARRGRDPDRRRTPTRSWPRKRPGSPPRSRPPKPRRCPTRPRRGPTSMADPAPPAGPPPATASDRRRARAHLRGRAQRGAARGDGARPGRVLHRRGHRGLGRRRRVRRHPRAWSRRSGRSGSATRRCRRRGSSG